MVAAPAVAPGSTAPEAVTYPVSLPICRAIEQHGRSGIANARCTAVAAKHIGVPRYASGDGLLTDPLVIWLT